MIVSTTLAGPGAEASIVDALRSCAHLVEHHLIALSGCAGGAVMEALDGAGLLTRCVFRTYEWPGSYGEARSEMLRWAQRFGATWALTVDCDERMDIPGLTPPPDGFDALCFPDRDLLYQKPRLLRCGAGLRWEWASAERLVGPDGKPPQMARAELGSFWELPKTPEQEQARARRGVENMGNVLAEGENAHARRHLAECLLILERNDEAEDHFQRVSDDTEAPSFERTWCRYRLAEFACLRSEYGYALRIASHALAHDPGLIQELGWVMAHANAQLHNYTAAALWCSYVLAAPLDVARGGHRGRTWRDGARNLLAKIEAAAHEQRPQAFPFQGRTEAFGDDYSILASALIQTVFPTAERPTHLDLGAGNGLLVGAMRRFGVLSWGVEANLAAKAETHETMREFIDYHVPLEEWGKWAPNYDLVSCVEVAEHIPAERADELVDAVCSRSKGWIYFSAATPGQGGHGHINEQPRQYWVDKFAARGWRVDWGMTEDLIHRIDGIRWATWLKRNALILRKF